MKTPGSLVTKESALDLLLVERPGPQCSPETLVSGAETTIDFVDVTKFGCVDLLQ